MKKTLPLLLSLCLSSCSTMNISRQDIHSNSPHIQLVLPKEINGLVCDVREKSTGNNMRFYQSEMTKSFEVNGGRTNVIYRIPFNRPGFRGNYSWAIREDYSQTTQEIFNLISELWRNISGRSFHYESRDREIKKGDILD